MQSVFNRARSPDVTIPLGDNTVSALENAGRDLNQTSSQRLAGIGPVRDLISKLGENPTAEQLGSISSRLGKEATAEFSGSQNADPALGKALFALKEHVDDLVGSSIKDPDLAAAYGAVRGKYRNYLTVTHSPTIYNSSAGTVNASALGRYLQGADEAGFMRGGNQSPLYNLARWGQATGEGKGAPPLKLADNLGIPWLAYHAASSAQPGPLPAHFKTAPVTAPLLRYGLLGPSLGLASGGPGGLLGSF